MTDSNIVAFREGTRILAEEQGYPVVSPSQPSGYVHDARCAFLLEALDAHLLGIHEERSRPGWFSASMLGRSDEELIAAYKGELADEEPTAQKLRVFSVGHDRDKTYKGWLKDCGLSAVGSDEDRKIRIPHLRLMGEMDDVLRSPAGFIVFEMKTINPYQFARLTEPLNGHLLQVHAYMGGSAISEAIVLYENKATQELRAFYVPFDAVKWDEITTRLRRLRQEAES